MYTLFGIGHGKVIATILSLMISIDSTIYFAPDFILEKDVQGVCRLPSSEIADQIEM